MKNFAYSILGCLLLSLNAAFAQKTWSFDGQDPLLSCDGKSLLNLYTIKEIPEFVTGVEGKALVQTGIPLGWIQPRKEMFRRCPDGLLWNLIRRILLPLWESETWQEHL